MSKTRIVPVNEDILILQDRPETQVGKIELAGAAIRQKNTGTIIAVGPGVTLGYTDEDPRDLVGQRCQFAGTAVTALADGEDTYVIVHEKDVQCLLVTE